MKIKMFMAGLLCLSFIDVRAQTISGNAPVCVGSTVALTTTAPPGGTWSSDNTSAATIGASDGVVSGVAAGTSTISYVSGGTTVTSIVTVNTAPSAISGGTKICYNNNSNNSITLSATPSGGKWSSSSSSIVLIDSTTGKMTGTLTAGTITITYKVPGCAPSTLSVKNFGDPANIPSISGTTDLCGGQSCTVSIAETGGSWWVGSTYVSITSGGVATCSSALPSTSTWRARYYFGSTSGTCYTQGPQATINPIPASIAPPLAVCQTSSVMFSKSDTGLDWTGGTWSSSNAGVATISSSTRITVKLAITSPGTSVIKYTLPTGCYTAQEVTINPVVSAITGTKTVCVGSTTTLGNTAPGGTWSTSASGTATVDASGVVTGVSPGTATITYTLLGSPCSPSVTTAVVTVFAAPTISGSSFVCEESTTTLTGSPSGGIWSSSDSIVGPIGATTGILTGGYIDGHKLDSSDYCAVPITITYTTGAGCIATKSVAVNDIAPPFSYLTSPLCAGVLGGASSEGGKGIGPCGAGLGLTLWTSSNPEIATVDQSGNVTGLTEGTVTISYTRGTYCYRTAKVTIKPTFEAPITGTARVCEGGTTDLDCTETGGTWTSSAPNKASVDASTGEVTGVTSMYSNIKPAIVYTLASGACKGVHVTVNTLAISVSPKTLCTSNTTTITYPGSEAGTWSSSNTGVATVSGSGTSCVVSGIAPGTAHIIYQFNGSICRSSVDFTVFNCLSKSPIAQGGENEPEFFSGQQGQYQINPNPSDGNITITSGGRRKNAVEVRVTNYVGVTVYVGKLDLTTGECKLMLDKLASGVYIVGLKDGDGHIFAQKIIIQK